MTVLVCGVFAGLAVLSVPPRTSAAARLRRCTAPAAPHGAAEPGSSSSARSRRRPSGRGLAHSTVPLAVGGGAVIAALGGGLLVILAPAAVAAAVLIVGRLRRRREVEVRSAAGVELVFALAAELRAGRPPGTALAAAAGAAGPLAGPLTAAAGAASAGASVAVELRRVAVLPGCAALGAVAAAWEVTEQVGGPVADVLDRIGQSLDDDEQSRRALTATLAAPRTTMLVLAVLPLFGILLGQSLGAHPLQLLVHRPLGWVLLLAAAGLDTVGLLWTRLLTRGAQPA